MDRPDILLDHEQRISTLEGITSEIRERLSSLETNTNSQFDSLESRIDSRFDSLESRMTSRFNSQTQLIIGLYATIIVVGAGIVTAILTG